MMYLRAHARNTNCRGAPRRFRRIEAHRPPRPVRKRHRLMHAAILSGPPHYIWNYAGWLEGRVSPAAISKFATDCRTTRRRRKKMTAACPSTIFKEAPRPRSARSVRKEQFPGTQQTLEHVESAFFHATS